MTGGVQPDPSGGEEHGASGRPPSAADEPRKEDHERRSQYEGYRSGDGGAEPEEGMEDSEPDSDIEWRESVRQESMGDC